MTISFPASARSPAPSSRTGSRAACARSTRGSASGASAPSPSGASPPRSPARALVAALALAFTLDPVRAAAREFLDLFRVKRFAAVPVDPQRLERLAEGGVDFKSLVADQVQVVVAPQPPEAVDSPEAGAVRAGIIAQLPTVLPRAHGARRDEAQPGGQLPRPGRHRASSRRSPSPRAPTRSRSRPGGTARRSTSRCRRCWACATRARSSAEGRPAARGELRPPPVGDPAGGAAGGLRPRDPRPARPAPRRHERDGRAELLARDRLAVDAPRPGAGPGRHVPRGRGRPATRACS